LSLEASLMKRPDVGVFYPMTRYVFAGANLVVLNTTTGTSASVMTQLAVPEAAAYAAVQALPPDSEH
jgi:hypothetical protein